MQLEPQRLVRGYLEVGERSPQQVRHIFLAILPEGQQPLTIRLFQEARFDLHVALIPEGRLEQQRLVAHVHLDAAAYRSLR